MILTEEEAKTKWCPFTHLATMRYRLAGYNRDADEPYKDDHANKAQCIASHCMAWRTVYQVDDNGRLWETMPDGSRRSMSTFVQKGFCGLAGTP